MFSASWPHSHCQLCKTCANGDDADNNADKDENEDDDAGKIVGYKGSYSGTNCHKSTWLCQCDFNKWMERL